MVTTRKASGEKKHAAAAHFYLHTIHYTEHLGEEKWIWKVLQCNNFPHELENASTQKIKAPLVTQKFNKLLSCQQLQQTK
jgi:hypothetical protein